MKWFISNCCGASLIENTDLCSNCREHCEEVEITENDFNFGGIL